MRSTLSRRGCCPAAADAEAAQDGDAQADFFRDTGGGTLN